LGALLPLCDDPSGFGARQLSYRECAGFEGRLAELAGRADGVRIYIGGESQIVPFEELSVVSAPYEVDGKVVGTLGVIGPTRMAYDRMIQIVDITSKLVSNALSHHK